MTEPKEAKPVGYHQKNQQYVISQGGIGFPLFLILLGTVWLVERLYEIDLPLVAIILIGWGLWAIAKRFLR
jgi:EamA domain-containing membrane protein RarD|tara:strand:+ start:296 stop:508 length:213 start_codon:yes stop_codon:yes gene_type:complete